MAISTYTELKAEVFGKDSFSHRTDLSSKADTFSILAESVINKDLRTLEMEKRLEVTFDDAFYTLPSDFMELRAIDIERDGARVPIKQYSPQDLDAMYSRATGTVGAFAIHGGQIELRPEPSVSSTATGDISYYARVPDLVTNATNEVLVNYPMIYLSAMMIQVYLYLQDKEELANWAEIYKSQIKMANKTSSASQYVLPQVVSAA